jgi:hypothetical protein
VGQFQTVEEVRDWMLKFVFKRGEVILLKKYSSKLIRWPAKSGCLSGAALLKPPSSRSFPQRMRTATRSELHQTKKATSGTA